MGNKFPGLSEDDTELVGRWTPKDGRLVADQTCRRIEWLIEHRLERVASTADGWDVLFRDRHDGRFWERTFPQSEMHGGGPPLLRLLTPHLALLKYPAAV
jgi:hypothetical protein